MLNENVGCNKGEEVVNDGPVIELLLDVVHEVDLNSLDSISVILEPKSLVLVMDH